MTKARGVGMIFRRGPIWWIQYHWRGRRYRETSRSRVRRDAVTLLRLRMADMGKGQLRGADLEKTMFEDLVQMVRTDYAVNQRRSTKRLNTSLRALTVAFEHARACDLTLDRLNRYVSDRMTAGIAPATVKLELTHLHKAFRLAERAGKAICPPFPQITVQNVRTGFFDRNDFEAVRSHLPEAFRGPITFAYLTGWRVPSEVLTLQWKQVDFSAGIIRLEPGTTKNDEGRVFPFGVLPELATLLRWQWEQTIDLEMTTDQTISSVFHWNANGVIKAIHPKVLYRRWKEACKRAGVPKRIPHDFRRTAVRNLERAGVPRSVAMKLTGHKTEAVYRRYAIVCEADLTEGLRKLASLEETLRGKLPPWGTQTDFSHSLATVPALKPQITRENVAEGARFELAVPLRGLRFSRPARSAAPSPLRIPASGLQSSSFIKPSLIIEAPCLSSIQQVPAELNAVGAAPVSAIGGYVVSMRSSPPIYGRKASGMQTVPSACWYCSNMATTVRPTARPEPFRVWTNSVLESFLPRSERNRMPHRRAWNASKLLQDEISRKAFCDGSQTSMS